MESSNEVNLWEESMKMEKARKMYSLLNSGRVESVTPKMAPYLAR